MSEERTPPGPDVLVVGAGPVGLTAAHELARHGLRVRLVDAADGPATTSRALATHARTLETYDQMGVLDALLPRGRRVEHFTLHQNGRRLVRFDTDYSRLPTRFPFTLMVDQAVTEDVLRTAAAARGVPVEWNTRLTGFEDTGSGVRAELRHADGSTETVGAAWLVGTDGGHSTVRKRLELPLTGDSNETWLIADAVVHTDLPADSLHWMRTREGTVMLVPFPDTGKWRLLDTRDATYDGDDAAVAARFARKISAGTGSRVTVEPPSWVSVFTIQQRMIPAMRVGRCFVAGDAAHVHSPASGQGMNTGVQDACNLAWKLAAVHRGHAGEELLDTYGAERVQVGAGLLASTRFATVLVQLRNRWAAAGLRGVFTFVRTVRPLKSRIERKIMGGMSALGLSYDDGPLTLAPTDAAEGLLTPGARACQVTAERYAASAGWRALLTELRCPNWKLLAVDGPGGGSPDAALAELAERYAGVVRVRLISDAEPGADDTRPGTVSVLPDPDGTLRADLAAAPGSWLLVRPDGYVAATGADPHAEPVGPVLRRLGVRAPEQRDAEDSGRPGGGEPSGAVGQPGTSEAAGVAPGPRAAAAARVAEEAGAPGHPAVATLAAMAAGAVATVDIATAAAVTAAARAATGARSLGPAPAAP